jgi:hypothetical protein
VYVPIASCVYPQSGYALSFDVRPAKIASYEVLMHMLASLDIVIEDAHIIPLIFQHQCIGFKHQTLYYYHKADERHSTGIVLPYDPRDIDQSILRFKRQDMMNEVALRARYRNRLYQLFVTEFVNVLQTQSKNKTLREAILKHINDTNFNKPALINKLRINLELLLGENYISDLMMIKEIMEFPKVEIYKIVNESFFMFDFQLLYDLKTQEKEVIVKRLKELLKEHVTVVDIERFDAYFNIYTSCVSSSAAHCVDGKLAFPDDKTLEVYFEILADDILNRDKTFLLTVMSGGVFDTLDFKHNPEEKIYVL